MSAPVSNFSSLMKDVFSKFCFCLGLGTAAHFTYHQVQSAFQHPTSPSLPLDHSLNVIQEKVNTLAETPLGSVSVTAHPVSSGASATASVEMAAPVSAQPIRHETSLAQNQPANLVAGSAVSASPSPGDPSASPSASPGEVAANGENSPPQPQAQLDANGNPIPQPEVQVTAAPGIAYVPNYEMPYPGPQNGDPANALNSPVNPPMNPNDVPLISPNAAAYAAQQAASATNTIGGGSSAVGTFTGARDTSSGSASNTGTTASLSAQDIAWITHSAVKGNFSTSAQTVSGMSCNQDSSGSCAQQASMTMYPSRWATNEGLETAATLSLGVASNGLIEFNLTFNLQNAQLSVQPVTLAIQASSVNVHTTTTAGITYKTYHFTLPNMTALGQNSLTQMNANLIYQIGGQNSGANSALTATLMNTSTLNFSRTSVTTVAQAWDPTSATRSPAATAPYLIANTVNYTINLQKQ